MSVDKLVIIIQLYECRFAEDAMISMFYLYG